MPRVKKNSYDEYNSPLATRLRELMSAPGMNQSKLADHIGVTRQAVSAYSLGISLPDIEKFEKIAEFFEVSTEYLLGRTDVMRPDITKQAISETLQLSEAAIDKIQALQQEFRLEQTPDNDWKLTANETEPLASMFSDWLEAVALDDMMSSVFRAVTAAASAQDSGYHSDSFALNEEQKTAIFALKQQGYLALPPTERMDFFEQKATKVFVQSVERLESEAIQTVIQMCEEEKAADRD